MDAPELLHVEAAAARAWPVAETEDLHGWILGRSGARSRRLNSVQTLSYDTAADVAAAIKSAERWYEQRLLPPCFRLADAVQPAMLDAALEGRGYVVQTPTSVLIAKSRPMDPAPATVELVAAAEERVRRAICDPSFSAQLLAERQELFARIAPAHRFALVMKGGVPAAGGLCVADGDLAGLFSMRTQAGFRRQGLARAIALRLLTWAREQGCAFFYLQVEDDNAAALGLYRQLGFERLYGYHYREKI